MRDVKCRIATIIPARNEEKFIGETLIALLNQDIDNNNARGPRNPAPMQPVHGGADRCPQHNGDKKQKQHVAQPVKQPER